MKAMIEQNRTALGLMSGLLVIVLGFSWWQFLYKPASTEHQAAVLANQTAQGALSQAQTNLQKAQQEVDAAKRENGGKFDTSIAKVQVAREAVPNKARIDDALFVLAKLATRSGIRTNWNLESVGDAATSTSAAAVGDATAMEVDVDAVGKWSQLKTFISLVESSVSAERGQMHVRGRLFNVVKIHAGSADSQTAGGDGQSATDDTLLLKPGEYHYKITIAMYTSNFGADQSAGAGATGTTPTTGGTTATDPNAAAAGAGATGTTPSGSATTPGSTTTPGGTSATTPGATSTTPSGTGATSPTGSATTAGTPTAGAGATSTTGVTP